MHTSNHRNTAHAITISLIKRREKASFAFPTDFANIALIMNSVNKFRRCVLRYLSASLRLSRTAPVAKRNFVVNSSGNSRNGFRETLPCRSPRWVNEIVTVVYINPRGDCCSRVKRAGKSAPVPNEKSIYPMAYLVRVRGALRFAYGPEEVD